MDFANWNFSGKSSKSYGILREGAKAKYAWIQEHRNFYPIGLMRRVRQMITSGFCCASKGRLGPRAQRTARILEAVAVVYHPSNHLYGSYKFAHALKAGATVVSAWRAGGQSDAGNGAQSGVRSVYPIVFQADPRKNVAPSLLQQHFTATPPNPQWVAEGTYMPSAAGWICLVVVLDLFSRKAVG